MNEFNEITKNPLVMFVVSLFIVGLLGLIVTLVLFKSMRSTATVKSKRVALGGGVAFFTVFFVLVCYYFLPILMRNATKDRLEPVIVPQGSVSYTQPEFALALPSFVNQNQVFSLKYFLFNLNKPGLENADAINLSLLTIGVMQVPSIDELDLEDFSKNSINKVEEQLTTVSNDPNFSVRKISKEYTSFLGRNAISETIEFRVTEQKSGEIKTFLMKMKSFADEKSLRLIFLGYTPDETTEKIVSTLNIP